MSKAQDLLRWAALLCAIGGIGFAATASKAQSLQQLAPEGYVDRDGIWSYPGNIPVCWEMAAEPHVKERDWVRDEVTKQIANQTSITFLGWEDCTQEATGIRIRIADESPTSEVGRQWDRDASGKRRQDSSGRWIPLPTRMVLNFTFDFHSAFRDTCKPKTGDAEAEREHCIRALAVHEFLHAVGFLHEHLRADAPIVCKERYAHLWDVRGFRPEYVTQDYDADSHMNYCASMYRNPIKLSAGDYAVLQKFYPKP